MQIVHRITLAVGEREVEFLRQFGIVVAVGIATFEVTEDHPSWLSLAEWSKSHKAVDVVFPRFSSAEIAGASILQLLPTWHYGYPQPEDEYISRTYNTDEYCDECGVGLKQRAAFRMKGEPKWGRNQILQLNWVFDEFFVAPQLRKDVLMPLGIAVRPVLDTKSKTLATVSQIDVVHHVDVPTDRLDSHRCSNCHRVKYRPVKRSPFPLPLVETAADIMKTNQYFGTGASAYQAILVTRRFWSHVQDYRARGVEARPCLAQGGTT